MHLKFQIFNNLNSTPLSFFSFKIPLFPFQAFTYFVFTIVIFKVAHNDSIKLAIISKNYIHRDLIFCNFKKYCYL